MSHDFAWNGNNSRSMIKMDSNVLLNVILLKNVVLS